MALGPKGFTPTIGDLVKVVCDRYKPIAKGTIARIAGFSPSGEFLFLEGYEEIPVDGRDVEVVAYKIGGYDVSMREMLIAGDGETFEPLL